MPRSDRCGAQHTAKMHEAHAESLGLLALVCLAKYGGRGDLLHLAQRSAEVLVEAYRPPRQEGSEGSFGDLPQGPAVPLGQDVRALAPVHDSVRFFRYGGLALAELADIRDAAPGLLSTQDPLKDAPSSWAAKSLLLGGWEIVTGLAKMAQADASRARMPGQGAAGRASEEGGDGVAEPEFIEDETAQRPAGWLEEEAPYIADPGARRPPGWVDEEDGVWEAALIANPKCRRGKCGKWLPPLVRHLRLLA
jgi:hypothetical protein